jgi:hypothetical protein
MYPLNFLRSEPLLFKTPQAINSVPMIACPRYLNRIVIGRGFSHHCIDARYLRQMVFRDTRHLRIFKRTVGVPDLPLSSHTSIRRGPFVTQGQKSFSAENAYLRGSVSIFSVMEKTVADAQKIGFAPEKSVLIPQTVV